MGLAKFSVAFIRQTLPRFVRLLLISNLANLCCKIYVFVGIAVEAINSMVH